MTTIVEPTPVDRYLAEQQHLTAVEQFARRHDEVLGTGARSYRDLIPLERPGAGQQYGFEVDLDACTGCKACVSACNHLNGLDEGESWRSVGLLYGYGAAAEPFLQTVTTACHHCIDPGCMNGCPVNAYEKDGVTGIVRHLDDQCIGCGYCTLTCPYEVPQFNRKRGIVRKCDMCSDRLAAGEAPACAQACPTQAIKITVVETQAAAQAAGIGSFLPASPSPSLTVPTTRYVTSRELLPDLLGADHFHVRPGHAHLPLAVMLVLTQLSVGAVLVDLALSAVGGVGLINALHPSNAIAALALGLLALGVSVLHLGRPLYAFRAIIGVRSSWLSREIIAFGAFALLAGIYAGTLWVAPGRPWAVPMGILTGLTGVAGVACSVMVYAATGRRWWRAGGTGVKFALTSLACGLSTVLLTTLGSSLAVGGGTADWVVSQLGRPLAALLAAVCVAKLAWEAGIFRHLRAGELTELKRVALLMTRDLRVVTRWRFGVGVVGGVLVPLVIAVAGAGPVFCTAAAGISLLAVVAGELLERSQFFRACAPPRMPGGL